VHVAVGNQRETGNKNLVVVTQNVLTQFLHETFRKITLRKPEKEVTLYVAWFILCLTALPKDKIIILSNETMINEK
jgi:hypothetical protein